MKKFINLSLLSLILSVLTIGNALGMQDWYRHGWQPKDGYTVYCNAGILPYAVDTDGNRFFLLGLEPGGHTQTGKTVVVDFGGQRDNNENPKDTATREFSEETRGIMGWNPNHVTINEYADIDYTERVQRSTNFIQDQLTLSHPIISILPNNKKKTYTIYHEYLVEIDYISPDDVLNLPFEHGVEKIGYRWVSATELLALIPDKSTKFDYASCVLPHTLGDLPLRFPFVGFLHHHKKDIEKALAGDPARLQNIQHWNGLSPLKKPPLILEIPEKTKKTDLVALPVEPGATLDTDEEIPDTGPVTIISYPWKHIYTLTAFVVALGGYALYHWLNPKDEAEDEKAAEFEATAV